MKVIIAAVTISCAMVPVFGQAAAGAGSGRAATGAINPGTAVSPRGVAGQGAHTTGIGATLNSPAGQPVATPGTPRPVGAVNSGGLSAIPPQTVGRTFERTTIGGGPTDTVVDPAGPQPTFRFPPASTLATNGAAGGNGLPDPGVFPGNPVRVDNTVGANVGVRLNTIVDRREPTAVNLPPGARIVTNFFGVAEAIVPPPAVVSRPTAVGGRQGVESGRARVLPARPIPPQPAQPPRSPSVVQPR